MKSTKDLWNQTSENEDPNLQAIGKEKFGKHK